MTTFNSITITPLRDSDGYSAPWKRAPRWSVEHYPDTNTDEVQFGGLGNAVCTVEVLVDSDADAASLQALVNGTAYTLADFPSGTTYTGVRLRDWNLKRRPWAAEWRGTLVFEREAS